MFTSFVQVKDFDIEDWKQFTSDHELPKEGDNTRDPRDTRITMSEVVLPLHANTMGITFGGQVNYLIFLFFSCTTMYFARMQSISGMIFTRILQPDRHQSTYCSAPGWSMR